MKELNTPLIVKFIKNICLCGNKKYNGSELFNLFNDYIKIHNYKCEYTSTKFGIDIKKFKGIEKKKSNFIEYNINRDELKQYLMDEYKIEFYDEKPDVDFLDDNTKENDDDLTQSESDYDGTHFMPKWDTNNIYNIFNYILIYIPMYS